MRYLIELRIRHVSDRSASTDHNVRTYQVASAVCERAYGHAHRDVARLRYYDIARFFI